MSIEPMSIEPMPSERVEIQSDAARQGETGHGVRYVLMASLVLAIIAMALALTFAR
jgi:hypothetical protein